MHLQIDSILVEFLILQICIIIQFSCIAVRNGTQVDFIESTKDIIPNQTTTTTTATNPTAAIPVGLFKAMCWINKQIHNNLSSSSVAAALTMNKTSRIILITATSI